MLGLVSFAAADEAAQRRRQVEERRLTRLKADADSERRKAQHDRAAVADEAAASQMAISAELARATSEVSRVPLAPAESLRRALDPTAALTLTCSPTAALTFTLTPTCLRGRAWSTPLATRRAHPPIAARRPHPLLGHSAPPVAVRRGRYELRGELIKAPRSSRPRPP